MITAARFRRLDVPMKKAFGIAGGAQAALRNVLVEIELSSGEIGLGEAAPLPAFNGETQDDALAALAKVVPSLVGKDERRWRDFADLGVTVASAGCAIESAIVDALARSLGVSLVDFFGGKELHLVTDVTITTGTVEDAAREAREFRAFKTLKIKIGGGGVDEDVRRVLAVRKERPDAVLTVDANAGMTLDEALRFAAFVQDARIAMFEQPIAGPLEAIAELRAKAGLLIALDESITRAGDVLAAAKAGACDVVNVKLMKSGVAGALDIASAARECGLGLMIGGMVESRLGVGTSACLAAGLGGFAHFDLDTPLFLAADPFDGGYAQDGERIDLSPITRGAGITCRP